MLFLPILQLLWLDRAVHASPDFPDWTPPNQGDVRSPCPLLNSLANHNIIPHDGRNLTIPLLITVLNETLNISPEITTFFATAGLALAPDPSLGHFQLDDLNKHNAIEHDASLSRADFHFVGKQGVAKFNYDTFKRWFSHFRGQEFIDIESAAKARFAMVRHSRDTNPEFTYGETQRLGSYIETTLYFKAMVDTWGRTRKEFVRILFEQERLPYAEGWRRPKEKFDGFVQTNTVLRLALATPEKTSWSDEIVQEANEHSFVHGAGTLAAGAYHADLLKLRTAIPRIFQAGPWEAKRLTRVLKRKIAKRLRVTLHKFDYRHAAVGIGRENAGKMFSNGYDDNIVKIKEGKVDDKNIDIIELHNSRATSIGTRNHTISINIVKDVEV